MKRILGIVVVVFSLSGCAGGDKCTKAIDKAMGFAKQMMEAMAGAAGGDAAKMKAEMEKQMQEAKEKGVAECRKALAENKAETEKALDCMIAATNLMDLGKCEGVDKMVPTP
jgi:hypothetical protein